MLERWRQPATVLELAPLEQGLWLPDGRVQGELELTLDPESVDRLRSGFLCAKCLEPFEQAWPERCHVCGAPIRSEQAAYFAREHGGERYLGPSTTLADERERLREGDPNGN